ncbi:MAG: PadR family transcriptional regulator, partial [Anaerolineae bacterium]|nr:PadR family transcriptional regulator [Anaerolineae bacterium]
MTDAELAVLSILFEGPITGPTLQAEIARRGLRAWTDIGVKSLSYLLEKLEQQGLAQGDGPPDQPAYQKYRLTPAGLGVLKTAVAELLSTPRETSSAFELGLANLHVLRPGQTRAAFAAYRDALAARLAQAHERRQQIAEEQAAFAIDALFSHRIALLEAELAWVQGWIARWEAQAPPDERTPIQPASEVDPMQRLMLPRDPASLHRVETNPGRPPPPENTDHPADPPPDSQPGPDRKPG